MASPSLTGGTIIAAVRVLAWIELVAALFVGGVGVYQWATLTPGPVTTLEELRAQRQRQSEAPAGIARAHKSAAALGGREWLNVGLWTAGAGVTGALLLLLLASMAENLAIMRYEMHQRR